MDGFLQDHEHLPTYVDGVVLLPKSLAAVNLTSLLYRDIANMCDYHSSGNTGSLSAASFVFISGIGPVTYGV